MSRRTNRREFLSTAALAGAGLWVAGATGCVCVKPIFRSRRISPNEKLNIACIGAGGKGTGEVDDAASTENLVALCDVDDARAAASYRKYPDVKRFKDFRKMLDEMGKQIDAVTVSTPDHIHTPAAMWAMLMGKHAFVQKPMARTVYECRLLAETAKKHGLATQMGNQGTAANGLRRAVEVLHAGILGPVKTLHVWTNRPIWPQGQQAMDERTKQAKEPKPAELDWELWLGLSPKRPYNKVYLPFNWRGWYDWGTGAFGDMACHTLNMPYWGLRLCHPASIEAKLDKKYDEVFPSGSVVRYEFPARHGLPPLTMFWYDGDKKPNAEQLGLPEGEKVSGSGALIVGEKGMLYSDGDYGDQWHLTPKSFSDSVTVPAETKAEAPKKGSRRSGGPNLAIPETIPRSPGHFKEWVDACKGGKPAMSNFPDYSGLLAEIVVVGCVAQRLPGRKLEWDGPNMKAKNCPEAAALIHPQFPKGWGL